MDEMLLGIGRAAIPAFVAYLVGKGIIPGEAAAEVGAAIVTMGAAGWSVFNKRRAAKVAAVAAMPGTVVSDNGRTISILEPSLQTAAKVAATPASGP
mgnify:CR=1 FL=1